MLLQEHRVEVFTGASDSERTSVRSIIAGYQQRQFAQKPPYEQGECRVYIVSIHIS